MPTLVPSFSKEKVIQVKLSARDACQHLSLGCQSHIQAMTTLSRRKYSRIKNQSLKCTFVSPISTLKATKGVNSHAQMGCFPKFRPYHTISSHQKVRRGVNSHVLMGCFPNFDVWKLSVSHLFLRMLTLPYSLVPSESIPTHRFPNSTSDSFH
jgi:hypothetical protein